jgi:hypothetical protein
MQNSLGAWKREPSLLYLGEEKPCDGLDKPQAQMDWPLPGGNSCIWPLSYAILRHL